MADANLKARSPVTERFVTIQQSQRHMPLARALKPYHLRTQPPFYPNFRIAGRWLEHAGFHVGQRLRIAVEPGRLVITVE